MRGYKVDYDVNLPSREIWKTYSCQWISMDPDEVKVVGKKRISYKIFTTVNKNINNSRVFSHSLCSSKFTAEKRRG